MANPTSEEEYVSLAEQGRILLNQDEVDPVVLIEQVWQLWWRWADFEIFIISPTIDVISPPILIEAALLPNSNDHEFVYPIQDHGYKFTTSKGQEMFKAGMSNCKLFYTIEKMIYLLIERLKTGGISPETEVQISFGGHELAQRKAFESIINLTYNVVVVNFDPGTWGERYLQNVKRLADKGYGYPPESPRESFRQVPGTSPRPGR
jgi:hypothetical protein